MSDFVHEVELEGGAMLTVWDDDAPVLGFSIAPFNWRLRRAREAKGWTRRDLARESGINPTVVGDAEKLRRVSADSRWKMALALGVPEDVLFPGEIDALPADGPASIDVGVSGEQVRALLDDGIDLDPLKAAEAAALPVAMAQALGTLAPREREVLALHVGIDGAQPMTLQQIGDRFGFSAQRARQIEAKALRKLRHPSRTRGLRPFLDEPERPSKPLRPGPYACQRADGRPDGSACEAAFPLPGWMARLPTAEQRRPGVWCGVCWARYLAERARASAEGS